MCDFRCDITRLLHKGDVYNCELGENGDIQDSGLLAKTRPCIIVSANSMNSPKQYIYQVAPIRTEHAMEVNEDTVDYIVSERRKQGRIYVPIEMKPGDFRFIDITQMRPIHISKIYSYQGSIVNDELMMKINAAIMELYFDRDEFCPSSKTRIETLKEIEIIEEPIVIEESEDIIDKQVEFKEIEESKAKKKKGGRKSSFPMGFSKYFVMYQRGEITVPKLSQIFDMPKSTVYAKIKRYEELHPELTSK